MVEPHRPSQNSFFNFTLLLFTRLGQEFIPTLDEKDVTLHAIRIPSTGLTQSTAMQLRQRRPQARQLAGLRRRHADALGERRCWQEKTRKGAAEHVTGSVLPCWNGGLEALLLARQG